MKGGCRWLQLFTIDFQLFYFRTRIIPDLCAVISACTCENYISLKREPSWSWSYGSWIYNYLCNQCLSPLKLWVRIPLMARRTRYNILFARNCFVFKMYIFQAFVRNTKSSFSKSKANIDSLRSWMPARGRPVTLQTFKTTQELKKNCCLEIFWIH